MKIRYPNLKVICAAIALAAPLMPAQAPATQKTQNVIVVMVDGMRWQEVFRGADGKLMKTPGTKQPGDAVNLAAQAEKEFWRATPTERRMALMPFLWSVVATQGQIFGNRDLKSDAHVTNGLNFSYPGYAETLTGFVDFRIDSNDDVPNPDQTVFAWLNAKPAFAGKVAAFGAWQRFDAIFDKQHCGFVVNSGWNPLTEIPESKELAELNHEKASGVRLWPDEALDSVASGTAMEYIKARKPRVLFVGLGETDEWAHAGSYPHYLESAHQDDGYIEQIWQFVQSMPEYKDKTTLIILPDHGRGRDGDWTDHGEKIPESRETWMAFIGPDTAALGERDHAGTVTEKQIAATLAALLGEDYHAAVPKSGRPIADVLSK